MRQIYSSQPYANRAILELLNQNIQQSLSVVEAIQASIQDIKRNWNLL